MGQWRSVGRGRCWRAQGRWPGSYQSHVPVLKDILWEKYSLSAFSAPQKAPGEVSPKDEFRGVMIGSPQDEAEPLCVQFHRAWHEHEGSLQHLLLCLQAIHISLGRHAIG